MRLPFVIGGKDPRTPEERWLDAVVEAHENGEHIYQEGCPKCEDLTEGE